MDKTLPDSDELIIQAPSLGIKLPSDQPQQETTQPIVPTPVMPVSSQSDTGYVPPTPAPFTQNALPPDPFDSFDNTQDLQHAQDKPFDNVVPVSTVQPQEQIPTPQAPEPTTPEPAAIEPSPPVPPTPIFENSASSKKGFPKIFLIAIIFAIIIGITAAYYVSTANTSRSTQQLDLSQKTPATAPTENPLPTVLPPENATSSPTIEQTDLKTYINSTHGFELFYPSSWKYNENINEYGSTKFYDPNKSIPNSSIGDIAITPYKTTLSLNAWIDTGHPVFGEDLKKYYTVKQTTKINGNSVTEMTGGDGSTYGKVAYLKSGSYVYELFLQGTAASIKQDEMLNADAFSKILLSLKFSL